MTNSVEVDYLLTSEQRHAGYSVEFDGTLHLYHNGKTVDSFDVGIGAILCLRGMVQNHIEMQKSGVEFVKAMKGILLKPDMIKAIVEGRKTVTRRLDGLKEINKKPDAWILDRSYSTRGEFYFINNNLARVNLVKPRYKVGEIVYIKEAFYTESGDVWYKADGQTAPMPIVWRSPLFMPAWAARYFRQITDVRPERLQAITSEDCEAEGITLDQCLGTRYSWVELKAEFRELWDSIHSEQKWDTNPFVFRYEFKLVKEK